MDIRKPLRKWLEQHISRDILNQLLKPAEWILARLIRPCRRQGHKFLARLSRNLFKPPAGKSYLNVGGGYWFYPQWENIDYYVDGAFVDHEVDFSKMTPWPIEDGLADAAFCSHVIEHLSDEADAFLFKEIHRVLKPTGVFRLACPDMDKAFAAYERQNEKFFNASGVECFGPDIENKLVNFLASYVLDGYKGGPRVEPLVVQEKLTCMDKTSFAKWCVSLIPEAAPKTGHQNAYNFEKLERMLKEAGFVKVVRSEFRQSSLPVLRKRGFDNRPIASVYVEAFKQ